jgi:hypothetical protein
MPGEVPPDEELKDAIELAFGKLEEYGIIDVEHNYESAGEDEPTYTISEKFNNYFLEDLTAFLEKGLLFNEGRYYDLIITSMLKAAGGSVDMGSEPVMVAAIEIIRDVLDDETAPDHEHGYNRDRAMKLVEKLDTTGKYVEGVKAVKQTDLERF